jgi:hypothetical protein
MFDPSVPLRYLGLSLDYVPSPETDPVDFLNKHLSHLPPHILAHFGTITTAKQRTIIPTIRNRRLKYTTTMPTELSFQVAKKKWPHMWKGRERVGLDEGRDEKEWANHDFLAGQHQHIGKLGNLLGEYEEEREAERTRTLRRAQVQVDEFVPEEDEESDEETAGTPEGEAEEEEITWFERLVRERFIYGLLEVSSLS